MGSLFAKPEKKQNHNHQSATKPNNDVNDKDRAILDLKNARDRLKRYRKKLDIDSVKLTEQAKALIAQKQKDRALLILKLRRFKEKELNNVDNQLISVFEMIGNVEWEYSNLEVLKALKSGTAALNAIHQEMSVEDVANLLDETNEAIETENQINQMLAGQMDIGDDADIQAELAMLMGETVTATTTQPVTAPAKPTKPQQVRTDEQYPIVPNTPVLPSVPQNEVVSSKSNENKAVPNEERELVSA